MMSFLLEMEMIMGEWLTDLWILVNATTFLLGLTALAIHVTLCHMGRMPWMLLGTYGITVVSYWLVSEVWQYLSVIGSSGFGITTGTTSRHGSRSQIKLLRVRVERPCSPRRFASPYVSTHADESN